MRNVRSWMWGFVAIALFTGGFAYTYTRLAAQGASPPVSNINTTDVRLGEQASVVLKHILADGRLGGEERFSASGAELAGATINDLSSKHPAWSVVTFAADELVAEVRCADAEGGYLGESNGRVAVFEGSGYCSVLREQTDIPLDSVHPDERMKLAKGTIRYENEDNLQELLDGLASD